jgi:hypothetical protein
VRRSRRLPACADEDELCVVGRDVRDVWTRVAGLVPYERLPVVEPPRRKHIEGVAQVAVRGPQEQAGIARRHLNDGKRFDRVERQRRVRELANRSYARTIRIPPALVRGELLVMPRRVRDDGSGICSH